MNSAAGVQTVAAAEVQQFISPAMALQAIAHELRQPLGAIESIAYYLGLVLPQADVRSRQQIARVQDLVEQSNWILTCGLQLTDESPLLPAPLDLGELIAQSAARRALHGEQYLDLTLWGELPLIQMDPGRAKVLIENLLTLFERLSDTAHPTRLATAPASPGVSLKLSTDAPGYRSELSFGAGCGLSLACARRIVQRHRGALDLEVNPVTGIILTVVLP